MNRSMGEGKSIGQWAGYTNEVQAVEAVINIDLGEHGGRAHYRHERAGDGRDLHGAFAILRPGISTTVSPS